MNRRQIISFRIVSILLLFLTITPILFAELINDGSFESNPSSWEQYFNTACAVPSIGNWSVVQGAPANFDGLQSFWAGGACGSVRSDNGARKEIMLQPDAAILSFWFNPIKGPDPQNNDSAIVSINNAPIWTLSVDGITSPTGWNNALIDISQFADQNVMLSLEMQHDNDSDSASVFFDYIEVLHPSIQIDQAVTPESVFVGSSFIVEITIENSGDSVLNNISVTNSSFANCDLAAGILPDLNPGESNSYNCEVSNATLDMENTATVQATTTEIEYPVTADHTASSFVIDINPLLNLVVEPNNATVEAGEQITFVVTVSNNGNSNLVNVQISSVQVPGCTLNLNNLAAQGTAAFNCTYTPHDSETVTFTATAIEPNSNTETSVETAVAIEILPVIPPTIPVFNVFLPMMTNNFITHNELGEPNDSCNAAFPITPNQTGQFLAENIHDWYQFTLDTTDDLTIALSNFVPIAGQMTVWRGNCQNLTLLGQNGDFSSNKNISLKNQPPGTYFVWIISDGPINHNDKYNLLITTP